MFSQALAIIAQLRAGDAVHARPAITYLLSLQEDSGAWPSLIPSTGDNDVDSTAMAVMCLDLVDTDAAREAVRAGIAWIAAQQTPDGGLPGAAGISTNSTALAIQAFSLDPALQRPAISRGLTFLAARQNADGGFDVAADGQEGSDLRASTHAVGTSFGTLRRDLSAAPTPPPGASLAPTAGPGGPGGGGGGVSLWVWSSGDGAGGAWLVGDLVAEHGV